MDGSVDGPESREWTGDWHAESAERSIFFIHSAYRVVRNAFNLHISTLTTCHMSAMNPLSGLRTICSNLREQEELAPKLPVVSSAERAEIHDRKSS